MYVRGDTMANDARLLLRLPKSLKRQIEAEAKGFGVSASDLIRKKIQAVSLPSAPAVRMLDGRLKGVRILRIEVPMPGQEKRKGRATKKGRAIER